MLVGHPQEGASAGEVVGSLAGGLYGAAKGPKALGMLAQLSPHSRAGMLARLLGGSAEEAAAVGTKGASDLVTSLMRGESSYGRMSREAAETLAARIGGTAAKGGRTIVQEVNAARRAFELAKVAAPSKASTISAARLARETAAKAAVDRAMALRAGVQGAGQAAASTAARGAAAQSPAEIVLKIQQAMSMPGGKQAVQEWLRTQPAEVAAQISGLLGRGLSRPATLFAP
jgi:hypothetical protein